jgi:hypothetical protein
MKNHLYWTVIEIYRLGYIRDLLYQTNVSFLLLVLIMTTQKDTFQ